MGPGAGKGKPRRPDLRRAWDDCLAFLDPDTDDIARPSHPTVQQRRLAQQRMDAHLAWLATLAAALAPDQINVLRTLEVRRVQVMHESIGFWRQVFVDPDANEPLDSLVERCRLVALRERDPRAGHETRAAWDERTRTRLTRHADPAVPPSLAVRPPKDT